MFARLFALVVAIGVLAAVVRGGARYFYCPMMQAVMDSPCCGGKDEHHAEHDTEALRPIDCCERHVQPHLPAAAGAPSAPTVFDAPFVATVPPIAHIQLSFARTPARLTHEERAGPRSQAQRRAELMVFLN